MRSKFILIVLSIAVFSACNAKLMELTQADAERGSAKFKEVTLARLNEGKNIYKQNCDECHRLKKPSSFQEDKWNKMVPVMVKKLNEKFRKEVVDAKGQELMLEYLVTMSGASKKK